MCVCWPEVVGGTRLDMLNFFGDSDIHIECWR